MEESFVVFEALKKNVLVETKRIDLTHIVRSGDVTTLSVGRDMKRNVSWQLMHPSISRRHAEIKVDPRKRALFILDCESTYGTFVNNKRLASKLGCIRIAEGSVIMFGASQRKWWLKKLVLSAAADSAVGKEGVEEDSRTENGVSIANKVMDERGIQEMVDVLRKRIKTSDARPDGFVSLDAVRASCRFKYTVAQIRTTIDSDPLRRLEILEDSKCVESTKTSIHVRLKGASQVHSDEGLPVVPLENPLKELQTLVHCTYFKHWNAIRDQGIDRQKKMYIYLFPFTPNTKRPVAGMEARGIPDILVYVDIARAVKAGIKFLRCSTDNDIIVSVGDGEGRIPARLFDHAEHVQSHSTLMTRSETGRLFRKWEADIRKQEMRTLEEKRKRDRERVARETAAAKRASRADADAVEDATMIGRASKKRRRNMYLAHAEEDEGSEEEEEEDAPDISDDSDGDFNYPIARNAGLSRGRKMRVGI